MPAARRPSRPASHAVYTLGEEIANAVSHGLAAALAVAGLCLLVIFAAVRAGTALAVLAATVFGLTLVALYLTSTLYHAITHRRAKRVLQVLDHAMIYFLIAGTYTPYCLLTVGGREGLFLCLAEWGLALVGAFSQKFLLRRGDLLNCAIYLVMGWLGLFSLDRLLEVLPGGGLWLLVAGGLTYSAGIVFYIWDRLPFGHAIWHLFTLAGSTLQFLSVLLYVIPAAHA